MPDWEVTLFTESNYIKKIRVNDYFTRQDAEDAALGMTGAKKIINCVPKTYEDQKPVETSSNFSHSNNEYKNSDDGDFTDGAIICVLLPFILLFLLLMQNIIVVSVISVIAWLVIKRYMRDT